MASKPVQTTDTHVNSIQFWRCGGFCSIPISKIPQVPTLISGPRNQALLLSLDTYVPHSIGTTADLCGIRPPRSSGTRLRDCSGPFGAHPSTLWAAQFLLHVSMQGCPCSLTGKGSRKCWKFKPHRLHVQNWTKTSGIQQASPTIVMFASFRTNINRVVCSCGLNSCSIQCRQRTHKETSSATWKQRHWVVKPVRFKGKDRQETHGNS